MRTRIAGLAIASATVAAAAAMSLNGCAAASGPLDHAGACSAFTYILAGLPATSSIRANDRGQLEGFASTLRASVDDLGSLAERTTDAELSARMTSLASTNAELSTQTTSMLAGELEPEDWAATLFDDYEAATQAGYDDCAD